MSRMLELEPFFDGNYATVAFASSDYFVPYLTVALNSLVAHADKNTNYDIFVFTKDATEEKQKYVKDFITRENVSVRFVNVIDYFEQLKLPIHGHIGIETYFRFVMPPCLKNFDRVLYLDADLIVLDDVNKLYSMDMQGRPIAATHDCMLTASINSRGFKEFYPYVRDKLGLDDIERYFQAGVMLFDIKQFNEGGCSEKLINMVKGYQYYILDQDALNEFYKTNYFGFESEWNWQPLQKHMKELGYMEHMNPRVRERYLAVKNPRIIHYSDANKPWFDPDEDKAVEWWFYAKDTPFYEVILKRMYERTLSEKMSKIEHVPAEENGFKKYIPYIAKYQENKSRYFKYRILSKLTWGKRRARYKQKKNQAKYEINMVKEAVRVLS